jgi:hypothetical protein
MSRRGAVWGIFEASWACDGIDHGSAQEEVHQLHCDGIHHHRAEDFVHSEVSLEETRYPAPDRPTDKTRQQGKDDHQPAGQVRKGKPRPGREERPHDHLPLAPDIDHIPAKGDADSQCHQEQGCGFDQCLSKRIGAAKGAVPQGRVGLDGIYPQEQ